MSSDMTSETTGEITTTINDKVATLEFFHPKANSLPSNLLEEIASTITSLSSDNQISIIHLKSRGCLLYTSPSPRDATLSRMPSSA